jgi:diguanylate cyclase (GGDEF)-like protein
LAEGDTIAIGSKTLLKLTFQEGTDPKFQSALQDRARRDSMSGAYNRDHFEEHLGNELRFARRHDKSLALLMIDVDGLGALNDKWGRVVADMTVARLARRIARHLRAEDLFARFAGGTFAVVCPETDTKQAIVLAHRLRKCVSQDPYPVVGDAILMTVTIGVGAMPDIAAHESTQLVAAATSALNRRARSRRRL